MPRRRGALGVDGVADSPSGGTVALELRRKGLAMRFKLLLATAAVAGSLLSFGFVADAQARVRCSYSGAPSNLMTVRASGFNIPQIRRAGQEIVVGEFLSRPARCSGG